MSRSQGFEPLAGKAVRSKGFNLHSSRLRVLIRCQPLRHTETKRETTTDQHKTTPGPQSSDPGKSWYDWKRRGHAHDSEVPVSVPALPALDRSLQASGGVIGVDAHVLIG